MTKELRANIAKQLERLEKKLEKIRNTVIDSNDEATWDSDYYYNLESKLEEILDLLRDKTSQREADEFGEPLVLEEGLLSLLDAWEEESEKNGDF